MIGVRQKFNCTFHELAFVLFLVAEEQRESLQEATADHGADTRMAEPHEVDWRARRYF